MLSESLPAYRALEWAQQEVWLLAAKAVFLPTDGSLLVADFHLGKAHSFRRQGLPVPSGTTDEMLRRLDHLLAALDVKRMVFLGDFLHAASAQHSPALTQFERWRQKHPSLSMHLVRGNHDRSAGDPPAKLGLEVVDEPFSHGSMDWRHHPEHRSVRPSVAGHRHPCARLSGRARDRMRLPCFELRERLLVLPAFGAFTGMHAVEAEPGLRRFITDGTQVLELP